MKIARLGDCWRWSGPCPACAAKHDAERMIEKIIREIKNEERNAIRGNV